MRVKKPDDSLHLQNANVILAFDYETDGAVSMQLEGLAVLQVQVPSMLAVPAREIRTVG